jgi:tetratricopeptide (TPR) repeat protein
LDFEQAHQIAPDRAEFHHNLAMARQSSGQYDLAAELWGLYVERFPENLNARLSRIANLTILGRLDEAREDASLAVTHHRESAEALLARVDLDVSRGQYALALMDLDQVLFKNPENLQGLLKRAQVLNRLSLYLDAIEDGVRALEIDPESPRILNNHAWTLAICPNKELRNPPLARELAQKAVEVTGGKDFGILDTLAVAVASTGDFSEAIRIATEATKTAPEGIRGLFENRLKSFTLGIVHNPSDDEPATWASTSVPEADAQSGEDIHDGLKEGELDI